MKSPTIPRVVLIGRTNAGKSTLFNRLTEEGKAIVSPAENTTRDQNRDVVYWKGQMCELIDTGGLDTATLDSLSQDIQLQVQKALAKANLVVFVVDGQYDPMPQDFSMATMLKERNLPTVLCINKVDAPRAHTVAEAVFAPLNIDPAITCSAITGSGTAELLDAVFKRLPDSPAPEISPDESIIKLALIGRPNVGKSSLFNALVGEDQVIVSELAHTTRDINDTDILYKGKTIRLLDTAGIRRKNRVGEWSGIAKNTAQHYASIERTGIHASLESISKTDVVLLTIEADKRVSKQDKMLVDYAQRKGKGLVIVVNKWDLVPDKSPTTINEYQTYFEHHLGFASHTPVLFISALEHQRVFTVIDTALEVYDARFQWAPQEDLDSILYNIQKQHPYQTRLHRQAPRKPLKLISLTQLGVDPPTFRLVSPTPKKVAGALIKSLNKHIHEVCGYHGTDITIEIRNS